MYFYSIRSNWKEYACSISSSAVIYEYGLHARWIMSTALPAPRAEHAWERERGGARLHSKLKTMLSIIIIWSWGAYRARAWYSTHWYWLIGECECAHDIQNCDWGAQTVVRMLKSITIFDMIAVIRWFLVESPVTRRKGSAGSGGICPMPLMIAFYYFGTWANRPNGGQKPFVSDIN